MYPGTRPGFTGYTNETLRSPTAKRPDFGAKSGDFSLRYCMQCRHACGEIRKFCKLPEDGQSLMRAAMTQLNLSARAYHRTQSVKLARTIADLAGCEEIQSVHLAEALQYRPKLMMG